MFKTSKYLMYAVVLFVSIVALCGCESKEDKIDPEAALAAKAEAYWNKRFFDKDYKSTYEMELEKDSTPYEKYLKMVYNAGQIEYLSVKTKSVEIENNKGVVDLTVRCKIPPLSETQDMTLRDDQWVFESNEWKHVIPDKDGTKPPNQR